VHASAAAFELTESAAASKRTTSTLEILKMVRALRVLILCLSFVSAASTASAHVYFGALAGRRLVLGFNALHS
jgi:hypothetical protein